MDILWQFVSPFLPYVLAALGAFGGIWGFGKIKKREGVKQERQRQATADVKAHSETIAKVLNETVSTDTTAALRERMRQRAKR